MKKKLTFSKGKLGGRKNLHTKKHRLLPMKSGLRKHHEILLRRGRGKPQKNGKLLTDAPKGGVSKKGKQGLRGGALHRVEIEHVTRKEGRESRREKKRWRPKRKRGRV